MQTFGSPTELYVNHDAVGDLKVALFVNILQVVRKQLSGTPIAATIIFSLSLLCALSTMLLVT